MPLPVFPGGVFLCSFSPSSQFLPLCISQLDLAVTKLQGYMQTRAIAFIPFLAGQMGIFARLMRIFGTFAHLIGKYF